MSFNPKTITIYSVGLLGGSLGLALKTSGFQGTVTGLSSSSNIRAALELGCIDDGYNYDWLEKVIEKTDLLFLCSPIHEILETLKRLGTIGLPRGLVITDVGSTKQCIVETARVHLPGHVSFIGGHPMAGSEKSGAAAADPYLFQNAIYVLTKPDAEPGTPDLEFAAFIEKYLGCRHVFMKPNIHDAIAAAVSHVPHLTAVALVNLAASVENDHPGTIDLAAGGFRDMTRIASAPYIVWKDILETNSGFIESALDRLIGLLSDIKGALNKESMRNFFESAAAVRMSIPVGNKGFIAPLHEVLVLARDHPGIISAISGILAGEGINIKDIEVLKVREGEGGTIRLAFESHEIACTAISLLRQEGFTARERE